MTRSNDSLKVIVVGIPKTLDDAGLQDLFGAYGSVADAKVVKDAATDTSRGFGFVTFTAQSAMRRAVKEMDKKQLEGRTLNVRQLVAKDQLVKKDTAKSSELAQRPCYLLRKGKCTKGDRCPFSHDTKGGDFGSCFEFVQNGSCKRGDSCKFFHPPPAPEDGADGQRDDDATTREFEPPAKKKDAKTVEKKAPSDDKKKPADAKKPATKGGEKDDKPRYCFAYQSGRCHRGKRCLYLHEKLVVPENEAPPAPTPVERKRPGDFEVVKEDESSKKRRLNSDDEDSDAEDVPDTKPVAKAKPAEKKAVEKKPSEKKVVEKKPVEKKATETKGKPLNNDEKPAKSDKPAVDENGKPIHTGPKPICRHFLKGLCKRGHICFFRHEQPTEEELKELLPLIKGGKNKLAKKDNDDDDDDDDENATPLQAVADHMSSFMANFDASKPFEPFVPSAMPAPTTAHADEKVEPSRTPKRKAGAESEEESEEEELNEQPPAPKRQRQLPKEKIDMGAAFDGADSDDSRPAKHKANKKRKPTKEEMKANREKLRAERRAKKSSKLMARERLKTQGEIELS